MDILWSEKRQVTEEHVKSEPICVNLYVQVCMCVLDHEMPKALLAAGSRGLKVAVWSGGGVGRGLRTHFETAFANQPSSFHVCVFFLERTFHLGLQRGTVMEIRNTSICRQVLTKILAAIIFARRVPYVLISSLISSLNF